MSELVLDIEEFTKRGVQLISLKEGLRFDSAAGQLYAHMLAAFANFERERIRERTLAGLARAKAQGKHLGRPRKTPPANPDELLEESLVQLKNVRFYTSADAMYAHIAEWNYLRAKFLAKSDYTCSSCKKRYKNETSFLYMDHILPIADGGLAFDEANLQVLCGRCHAEKSSSEASIRNKKLYEKSKLQIS
jgi:5-methylcytosine-specific restriction endonuclease McrA